MGSKGNDGTMIEAKDAEIYSIFVVIEIIDGRNKSDHLNLRTYNASACVKALTGVDWEY